MENIVAMRITELMTKQNLTLSKMGKELGVSYSTISRWTLEKTIPNAEHIHLICKQYNITPNWLFGWE